MALELNGTTGVSLVQDGVVTAADLASGAVTGTIVQIVTNSTTTETSKADSTFADTTLTATINKQQSSSKILILMSAQLQAYRSGGGEARGKARIVRDGTEVFDFQMTTRSYDGANLHVASSLQALNAIDTTTGTGNRTYTLQIANNDAFGGTDYRLNLDGGSRSSVILLEIS